MKNGVVKRSVELHPSDMAGDPANRSFQRLQLIELHPDPLANRGSLYELDLASFRRKIDQANSEGLHSRPSQANLDDNGNPLRAATRGRWIDALVWLTIYIHLSFFSKLSRT
jgi:hypothetical protein